MTAHFIFLYSLLFRLAAGFQEETIKFSVSEDVPIGTVIGILPLLPEFQYRVTGAPPSIAVDLSNGKISISSPLDRESSAGSLSFLVVSSLPSLIHCDVTIYDVNDNSPTFPLPFQNVSIVETAPVGSRIALLSATDPDAGTNGTITGYGIQPKDGIFALTEENGILYLELKHSLDRESQELIVYNVSATDGGSPPRSGYTSVYVEVLDVNDNAPTFAEKEITKAWNGDLKVPILLLNATDSDVGLNGDVTYSIPPEMEKHFRVDGSHLYATNNNWSCCPSAPCSSCAVTVRALDRGSPPLEDSLRVTVERESRNQHDPQIHIRLHPSTVDFVVLDMSQLAGRTVAVLTVTDEDGPIGESGSLEILSGDDENAFSVVHQNKFSLLRLMKNASSLLQARYSLSFRATDGQIPERSSTKILEVYVTSSSGPAPSSLSSRVLRLSELLPVGSFVDIVSTNVTGCRYSIPQKTHFHVDAMNGIITTSSLLNASAIDRYSYDVIVSFPPPTIRTSSAHYDVTIVDENDYAPTIDDVIGRIAVEDSAPRGTVLWNIRTSDLDKGDSGKVRLELLSSDGSEVFRIEGNQLKTAKELGIRQGIERSIQLTLRAIDAGTPPKWSDYTTEVVIKKSNRPPYFRCDQMHVVAPFNAPSGTVVTVVEAADLDVGEYGVVHFSLWDPTPTFSIDPTTGQLRTLSTLKEQSYELRVGAVDGGKLAASNNLTIFIRTSEKKSPTFPKIIKTFRIKEETAIGERIGRIEKTGTFESLNPLVSVEGQGSVILQSTIPNGTYEFSATVLLRESGMTVSQCISVEIERPPPAPMFQQKSMKIQLDKDVPLGKEVLKVSACVTSSFCEYSTDCVSMSIDRITGILYVSRPLTVDHLRCRVTVVDTIRRKDEMSLDISKATAKEYPRINATYRFSVREKSPLGSVIGRVPILDDDVIEAGLATPIGIFPDGVVYVRRDIDRSKNDVISFPVTVTHRPTNSRYYSHVHVYVADVNDHSPKCPQDRNFELKENQPPGSFIGYVNASDEDFGRNSVLNYRLIDKNNRISIGEVTGKIISMTSFDYELERQMVFSVEVIDNGAPRRKTICKMRIIVKDENDNSPRFDRQFYRIDVDINAPHRELVTVSSKDEDDGEKGRVSYQTANYHNLFEINPNGTVMTKNELAPDSVYNLTLLVSDNGFPKKEGSSFLLVYTNSNHSQTPVFRGKQEFRMTSDCRAGSVIGRVFATSGQLPVRFSTNDRRFSIDTYGRVTVVTRASDVIDGTQLLVTASTPYTNSSQTFTIQKQQQRFEFTENSAPSVVTSFSTNGSIIVIDPSSDAFSMQGNQLVTMKPLDTETNQNYSILIKRGSIYEVIYVTVLDVDDSAPVCEEASYVVHQFPATITLKCWDPDTKDNSSLEYRLVETDGLTMDDAGIITVQRLDDVTTTVEIDVHDRNSKRKPIRVKLVLIRNTLDRRISFPASRLSLLLSHSDGDKSERAGTESFGRITADAKVPLQYYLQGNANIVVDRFTGELRVSGRTPDSCDVTMIAVSDQGIATVEVSIEVIADSLVLPSSVLLLTPTSLASGQSVTSLDIGRNDVIFLLDDQYFYLRANQLFVKKTPPKDKPYIFDIEVRKGRLTAFLKVYVLLGNQSNGSRLELWVHEKEEYGTVVGEVPDRGKFEIEGDIGLTIDERGLIRTTRIFDYDEQQVFSFRLRSYDASYDVILFVDDVNDHAPSFESDVIEITVAEEIAIGAEIHQLRWTDMDFNNAFWFSLPAGNHLSQFSIDSRGILRTREHLDRETADKHTIVVAIHDGVAPFPYHTANCTIILTVTDVNDNAPEMTSSNTFLVKENSPIGHVIGALSAFDKDKGRNGRFSYRILPESLPYAEISIDPVLGYIKVNKPLDFETLPNISFVVEISDFGSPSLKVRELITVIVMDDNDHAPFFEETTRTVRVNETLPRGSPIYRFEALDLDSEEYGSSLYWLADGQGVFAVGPISGLLYLEAPLDFEQRRQYNLTVRARNIAGGNTTETQIMVEVEDLNDEAPRFVAGSPTHYQVYENLAGPYPAIIGSTVSEDADAGTNGLVAYSIFLGNTNLFAVNSSTGDLLSLLPLDREDAAVHEITVAVTDSGTPRLTSQTDIVVTVLDRNDNVPVFDCLSYRGRVRENSRLETQVVRVTASDDDTEDNADISYRILNESVPFSIGRDGWITVSGLIDREQRVKYELVVEASDHGRFTRHSTTVPVLIIVENENDNSPVIRNSQLDVFVSNDVTKGGLVHVVDAFDADGDVIRFNLSGPDSGYFEINERGEIHSKVSSLLSKAFCSVTVSVFDVGGLNTSASFTFYFDQPEQFPRFTTSPSPVVVAENFATNIFKFAALSSKMEPARRITYSILAGNDGSFEIDSLIGELSIRSPLDREQIDSYRIWIMATDSDVPPKSTLQSIDIQVDDVNDNPPQFEKTFYTASLMENDEPRVACRVAARDDDTKSQLTYSIVEGNDGGRFSIGDNGDIRSSAPLDREEREEYRLIVEVSDGSLKDRTVVQITVLDEDDNSPRFTRIFHAEIAEDTPIGTSVLRVSASDVDGHENHTFHLDDEKDTVFRIDQMTGDVYLKERLDREKDASYRLSVRVEDGSWSVRTNAKITVLDVNDNSPVFEQESYLFVAQDFGHLGSVLATDLDSESNGLVHYSIQRDNAYLTVDTVTGNITLIKTPTQPMITNTIIAHDNGYPMQSTTADVIVLWKPLATEADTQYFAVTHKMIAEDVIGQIQMEPNATINIWPNDIVSIDSRGEIAVRRKFTEAVGYRIPIIVVSRLLNDVTRIPIELVVSTENEHSPVFVERVFHFTISESAPIGAEVGSVEAADDDTELNGELQYSLMNSDVTMAFVVGPNGRITVVDKLDYEKRHSYTMNLTVSDRGWPMKRGHAQLIVDILDSNDNQSTIINIVTSFPHISHDDVICVPFEDADSAPYDVIEYSTPTKGVVVDPESGCLSFPTDPPADIVITVSNQDIFHSTVQIRVLDMVNRRPPTKDNVTITVSQNLLEGSVLYSDISSVFVLPDDKIIARGNELKIRGVEKLKDKQLEIFTKLPFSRKTSSRFLSLSAVSSAPPPLFDLSLHRLSIDSDVINGTVILPIDMILPTDSRIEIEQSGEAFCLSGSASLAVCSKLSTDQSPYDVIMKVISSNITVSQTKVVITVTNNSSMTSFSPSVGYLRENQRPGSILKLSADDGNDLYRYYLADDMLRKIFSLSEDGILSSLHSLDREQQSIYRIPISIQADHIRGRRHIYVRVLVDDETDSPPMGSSNVSVTVVGSFAVPLDIGSINPPSNDVIGGICEEQTGDVYKISTSCQLSVNSIKEMPAPITVTSLNNDTQTAYLISYSNLIPPPKLDNWVRLDLYASRFGVADFLTEFQRKFGDLTVLPLSVSSSGVSHSLCVSLLDSLSHRLAPSESLAVIRSFITSFPLIHIDPVQTVSDHCANVSCHNGGRCLAELSLTGSRLSFRAADSLWNIPEGSITTRCECPPGFNGNSCGTRCEGEACNKFTRASCNEQTCRNGDCVADVCRCRTGFIGSNCTAISVVEPQTTESSSNSSYKKDPCKSKDCGDGKCIDNNGSRYCQCESGYIASYCVHTPPVVSLAHGHVELVPTAWLRNQLVRNEKQTVNLELDAQAECNDSQWVGMDFRTMESHGTLLAFDYGVMKALIEIRRSSLVYRVTDGYRSPIEISLGRPTVNDGRWHTVTLELTKDRKTITLQVDGIGKAAKSLRPLPPLMTSSLRRVLVGTDGTAKKFDVCVRKLLINDQLQQLTNTENEPEMQLQYFTSSIVGDVIASCSGGSQSSSQAGLVAAVAATVILLATVVLIYVVSRLFIRWQNKKERGWKEAKEIDAFSMAPLKGQVNLGMAPSMTSSVDSRIYDVTSVGYETPDNQVAPLSVRSSKAPSNGKGRITTVADVQLDIRRPLPKPREQRMNPQYCDTTSSARSTTPPPQPAPRSYRNEAYF